MALVNRRGWGLGSIEGKCVQEQYCTLPVPDIYQTATLSKPKRMTITNFTNLQRLFRTSILTYPRVKMHVSVCTREIVCKYNYAYIYMQK